ncbi:hypothetical protein [Gemmatimonas sp.]|jgi:hypothetical protein
MQKLLAKPATVARTIGESHHAALVAAPTVVVGLAVRVMVLVAW